MVECAHCLQRTDRAAVSESKFGNLAFLPEMGVLSVLLNGYMKHLACGSTVNIAAGCEDLLPPLFTGKPCDHTGFDGGKVGYKEAVTGFRDECRADQFGQHHWDGIV